jgi:hypothetical protein
MIFFNENAFVKKLPSPPLFFINFLSVKRMLGRLIMEFVENFPGDVPLVPLKIEFE